MTSKHTPPKRYVYEARRSGQNVRRVYVGPLHDPVVRILQDAKSLEQATRQAAIADAEQALSAYARIEKLIRLVATESNRLLRQHRERQRRERLRQQEERTVNEASRRPPPAINLSRDEFDELVELAEDGDEDALEELRRLLRHNAAAARLLGDVAAHVQQHLTALLASESIVLQETVRQHVEQTRRDLLDGGDSPLETMLINLVMASMLDVNLRQIEAQRTGIGSTRRRRFEQALDRAHQRLLKAIEALQKLRTGD